MYYPNSNTFECDGCSQVRAVLGDESLREGWFAMWQHGWRAWALSMHSCPACEAAIAAEGARGKTTSQEESHPMTWRIWCEVQDGPTSYRPGWLKANGNVQHYETYREAKAISDDLNEKTLGHHCSFHYEPRR